MNTDKKQKIEQLTAIYRDTVAMLKELGVDARDLVDTEGNQDEDWDEATDEEDWSDIVAIVQGDRDSRLPRYGSFVESIYGEMQRMSREKVKESLRDRDEEIRKAIENFK